MIILKKPHTTPRWASGRLRGKPRTKASLVRGKQLGFSARGGPTSGWALPLAISRLGRVSLWLIIVAVLIIAGGTGYYFYRTPKTPLIETETLQEEAGKIEEQLEECFTEMRVKPTKETQEKCQSAQAKFKDFIKDLKNPLICEQFEQPEQFGLRNSCLSSVAKNLKDSSVCEKISPKGPEFPGPQSDCYTGVAVALKDYSTCEKIISPASPELTSSCYREVAVALKDPSGCEKIPEAMSVYEISFEERIVWAENYCYKKIAEILGDASMCEKIQNLDSRGRCWLTISEILKTEDPVVCEVIKELSDRRECYMNIIYKAEKVEFCEKVQEQEFKDLCYSHYAPFFGKASTCEKIQDQKIKDNCYVGLVYAYGPGLGDIKFCDKIQDGYAQDTCKVTKKTSQGYDASFCEELETRRGKDICYLTLILSNLDMNPEHCRKIQDRPEDVKQDYRHMKQECENRIKRESTKSNF